MLKQAPDVIFFPHYKNKYYSKICLIIQNVPSSGIYLAIYLAV